MSNIRLTCSICGKVIDAQIDRIKVSSERRSKDTNGETVWRNLILSTFHYNCFILKGAVLTGVEK